jgi:hypothetical protein
MENRFAKKSAMWKENKTQQARGRPRETIKFSKFSQKFRAVTLSGQTSNNVDPLVSGFGQIYLTVKYI